MKVFLEETAGWRRIGDADVDDGGSEYVVRLFGSASTIEERFLLVTISDTSSDEGLTAGDRVVLATPDQMVELLPNWKPYAGS